MYDCEGDVVGYSAIPESCFWYDRYEETAKKRQMEIKAKPEWLQVVKCGCCGMPKSQGAQLLRCAKCKSVGYCGKECQREHWNMGHKRDCAVVGELQADLLKEALRSRDE
jgi:MYND finger